MRTDVEIEICKLYLKADTEGNKTRPGSRKY